jgi:hypothetical protein
MYVSVGNPYACIAYIYLVTNKNSFVIAMNYRQDCPGFEHRQGKDIFSSCLLQNRPHCVMVPTVSCSMGFRVRFPEINLPGRDVDHPHPVGIEVKNEWSFHFNIGGFHIVVLFNLSEEKVHIPSNTTK